MEDNNPWLLYVVGEVWKQIELLSEWTQFERLTLQNIN